jgi:hypothetical protein
MNLECRRRLLVGADRTLPVKTDLEDVLNFDVAVVRRPGLQTRLRGGAEGPLRAASMPKSL